MSKIDELKKLREQIDIQIKGSENYPKDAPSVIITNHNRLTDIIYTPVAFDDDIVSLVSARLVYKQDPKRLEMINKYLNAFPIEAHGGHDYAQMGIDYASRILLDDKSVSICPEGAYLEGRDVVYRGRTGAARILFNSLNYYNFAYLLPVSIDIESKNDLDCYTPDKNDKVKIEIMEPINPVKYYREYNSSYEKDKNRVLHELIREGMMRIANSLNRTYKDEYIELRPKGNVIFKDGKVVEKEEAQEEKYKEQYEKDLKELTLKLISSCGDGR